MPRKLILRQLVWFEQTRAFGMQFLRAFLPDNSASASVRITGQPTKQDYTYALRELMKLLKQN